MSEVLSKGFCWLFMKSLDYSFQQSLQTNLLSSYTCLFGRKPFLFLTPKLRMEFKSRKKIHFKYFLFGKMFKVCITSA